MSGTSHEPPMISENDKFDETDHLQKPGNMTAETKEAMGYLAGSIKNPDKPAIKPQIVMVMTASEFIPWDYDKPTVSEWKT